MIETSGIRTPRPCSFEKLLKSMDSAMPLQPPSTVAAEVQTKRRGMQVAGPSQRKLATTCFHELTASGAWQRCIDKGLTYVDLETALRGRVFFLGRSFFTIFGWHIGLETDLTRTSWLGSAWSPEKGDSLKQRHLKDDRATFEGVHRFLKKEMAAPQVAPYVHLCWNLGIR